MNISFTHAPSTGYVGSSYAMDFNVAASGGTVTGVSLTLWSGQAKVTFDSSKLRTYDVGKLTTSKRVTFTVVPTKSGKVTVYAWADGQPAPEAKKNFSFTAKKPKTSSSHTSSSSGSGATGSTGTGSNTTPTGNLNSGVNGQAPSVAPSNNGAVLPGITGSNDPGQTPSTAPLVQNAGNSQSMEGASGPDELTFDKLASTQAAWLAALLVAFSLLLTQVRLGKANTRAARPVKPKGAHRRARRRTPGSRAL